MTAKRIALFGATSAIAAALARIYASEGAELVLIGRSTEALEQLATDLKIRGAADCKTVVTDLGDAGNADNAAGKAWSAAGGLDAAVIAFGALPDQAKAAADSGAMIRAIDVNFTAPAALASALAGRFESAGSGTIVILSSIAGDRGRASNYVYGSAKAGLQAFASGLRHRLYKAKVNVLDVRPGFVISPMTAGLDRSGPLWSRPERVAADIRRAIDAGKGVLYTPWWWFWIMLVIRALPRFVFHRSSL